MELYIILGLCIAANEKKLAHLLRLEGARERLRLVKADLMEEGSFDDAIMGCHGVFHTASPVHKPSSDPKACSSPNFTEPPPKSVWGGRSTPSRCLGWPIYPKLCAPASALKYLMKN